MEHNCPWGWKVCTAEELCYLCLVAKVREKELQIDEAVKAARAAKKLLLDHGYHLTGAVMRELDKITVLRMDPCIEKRDAEPDPKCDHEFVNQPLRGGWFCLNCNGQKEHVKGPCWCKGVHTIY